MLNLQKQIHYYKTKIIFQSYLIQILLFLKMEKSHLKQINYSYVI